LHFVDNLNPVLMHLGPLQVRWYGVMYALSFIIGYYLICYLAQKRGAPLDKDGVAELVSYLVGGVLFGGRLGYCSTTCLITFIIPSRSWPSGMEECRSTEGYSG